MTCDGCPSCASLGSSGGSSALLLLPLLTCGSTLGLCGLDASDSPSVLLFGGLFADWAAALILFISAALSGDTPGGTPGGTGGGKLPVGGVVVVVAVVAVVSPLSMLSSACGVDIGGGVLGGGIGGMSSVVACGGAVSVWSGRSACSPPPCRVASDGFAASCIR